MVRSRTATAIAGLFGSLVLSLVLWWYLDTFVFFLLVPFVPFLFRGRGRETGTESTRRCPTCGFRTRNEEFEYCPRDGRRLQ